MRRQSRRMLQQLPRIALIDGEAAELRKMFAVTRPLQSLPDTWIGIDTANGRHYERQAVILQRAERNLDHDFVAGFVLGDEVHLRSHGPRTWRATVGVAI